MKLCRNARPKGDWSLTSTSLQVWNFLETQCILIAGASIVAASSFPDVVLSGQVLGLVQALSRVFCAFRASLTTESDV